MYRRNKRNAKEKAGIIIFFVIQTVKNIFLIPSGSCRFYPTCSVYAKEAIEKYNIIRALIKIIIRVIKCNPLSKGGYDPV